MNTKYILVIIFVSACTSGLTVSLLNTPWFQSKISNLESDEVAITPYVLSADEAASEQEKIQRLDSLNLLIPELQSQLDSGQSNAETEAFLRTEIASLSVERDELMMQLGF